jgi:hypothetical protein
MRPVAIVLTVVASASACSRTQPTEPARANPAVAIVAPTAPTAPTVPTARHRLSVGDQHACARTADGHVACWGQLGHPASVTRGSRFYPDENPTGAQPVRGLDHIAGVVAGAGIHCAWSDAGKASCWGRVDTSDERAPSAIAGPADIIQIAGGDRLMCALRRDGHVACWDDPTWAGDSYAQRGLALLAPHELMAVADVRDAVEIAVGADHACARIKDGTVTCWERGGFGTAPVPGLTGAIDLDGATLGEHGVFAALQHGGKVVAWGMTTPAVPAALPADTTQIAVGGDGICVAGHDVTCWNPSEDSPVAHVVSGIDHPTEIGVGSGLSCAQTSDGHVHCWGLRGRLGDGDASELITATDVAGLSDVTKLATADSSTCALTATGHVACWGTRIGYVPRGSDDFAPDDPAPVDLGVSDAIDLTMSSGEVCIKRKRGTTECLGNNGGATKAGFYAKLTVATPSRQRARDEAGLRFARAHVTEQFGGGFARESWVCGKTGADLSCLEIFAGRGETDVSPERGFDVIPNATQVLGFDGDASLCALRSDGTIACGDRPDELSPLPGIAGVTQLAPSSTYGMCALLSAGGVMCWPERLRANHLGPGPIAVPGLSDAVALSGDYAHDCALRRTGAVACWGKWSLTGSNQPDHRDAPTTVAGLDM